MKKTFYSFLIFSILLTMSGYGQNFIQVTQSDNQRQISISPDDALEVKLPSTPSTGFGWYAKNLNENILKQVGDWEFVSDDTNNPIGTPGIQTTRFIGASQGTTVIEMLYKRPWESESEAIDAYKITIVSGGAYRGKEIKPIEHTSITYTPGDMTFAALPATFSWLAEGMCTVVKNQKSCGSCWAFAAVGVYESVIKIFDKTTRDLSEQWLVNCDKKSSGCGGGWSPMYMFQTTGTVYEADEPYKAANGTCDATYTYHEKIIATKQIATQPTVAQIKQAIYDYGPVWVAVCSGTNFSNYKTGVLTKSDGTQVNHAVVLVGWDDVEGCWVLRNSWGTTWGEKSGYMRIKYGVSNIGYRAAYIDYKGVIPHTTTAIAEVNQNSSVNVFPNPSNGVFSIDGLQKENTIGVYDVVGKLVYQTVSANSSVTIDLKSQNQGMYFYKVIDSSNQSVATGKLMVY